MTRLALAATAAASLLVVGACSQPDAPAPRATPPVMKPTPAPVAVHVVVPEGASPEAKAWGEELRTAVTAGHGSLSLAATAEEASVVVRIDVVETGVAASPDAVETGVEVTPEPEGEGEISVMRGALIVDGSAREFHLSYPGEVRPQAEALARNLRGFTAEGGTAPVTPPPTQ